MASPNKKRPETWAKRFALNLKTTEDIRQKVEERAQKSGRSITLEVEQQLIKSFEVEEKDALNEEIKAEMRGTIAALEERIAMMQEREDTLWPDAEARALGKTFSRALSAVQQVTGQPWRRDSVVAPILGGVMRRLIAENTRTGGSLFAELFDRERIDFLVDGIAKALGPDLRKALALLPAIAVDPLAPPPRARIVTTFRDRATQKVMHVTVGPEFDTADGVPPNPDRRSALARFQARRDSIDVETSVAYAAEDGASAWGALDEPPPADAAASALQIEEPATRLTGQEEATRLMAGTKPAPGQDSSVFDEALFAETMGPERPDDDTPPPAPVEPQAAPKRRRIKATA